MRVAVSASLGALLFSLTAGLAAGYFYIAGVGLTAQQLPPPIYLGLASLTSFVALYPAPIIYFFWLGTKATGLYPLGRLIIGILLGSIAGRSLGVLLVVLGSSSNPVYAISGLEVSIQFFFLCVGTLSISYLRKTGQSALRPS